MRLSPKLIQVCSTPGKHSVSFDGQTVFTGKTEIDCALYLHKSVCDWPVAYRSSGPGVGQGFNCLSSFVLQQPVTGRQEQKIMYTTFEDEQLVYRHKNGEALVTATINGKRQYVAVTKDGFCTDYPRDYGMRSIFWDNPEWFTTGFKLKVREAILAGKGL